MDNYFVQYYHKISTTHFFVIVIFRSVNAALYFLPWLKHKIGTRKIRKYIDSILFTLHIDHGEKMLFKKLILVSGSIILSFPSPFESILDEQLNKYE